MVAVAIIGGAVVGAGATIASGNMAAGAAESAANSANAESRRQFDLQRSDLAPYRELGTATLPTLKGAYGLGTPEENAAALERFKTATPDYGFGFDEGNRALMGVLNRPGGVGLGGGGAIKAATRYGQDYATTRFGDWRNSLSVPAGYGSNAVAQGNQASQNYANTYGANTRAAGDARASAYGNIGTGIQDIAQAGAYAYGRYGQPQYVNPDGTARGSYVRQ